MAATKKTVTPVTVKAKAAMTEEPKTEVKKEVAPVKEEPAKETKEAVKEVKEAVKETEKKAPVKKAAAKKASASNLPAKKTPANKAELKSLVHIQFAGKSYSQEDLVKIARDVWKYDLKMKIGDLESVELYIKPEENMVYYVMNKEFTGSFYI